MEVKINNIQTATSILECMMIHKLPHATSQDSHLQQLKANHQRTAREQKSHSTEAQTIQNAVR